MVPANSFDNVKGKFPVGFFIWHLDKAEVFTQTVTDVYNADGNLIGKKGLYAHHKEKSINDWMIETRNQPNEIKIGYMSCRSHDFSNVNYNFIMNDKSQMKSPRGSWVTDKNLKHAAIYIAVCHCIEATWLNDRDQFLYPNDGWKTDKEFQADCLVYTLFSNSNNIQSRHGANHWIPFTEKEVGAQDMFTSHLMSDYIEGKNKASTDRQQDLFSGTAAQEESSKLRFSPEAQAVMSAARELWCYYHKQPDANPNASYYEIRLHFQGTKITKSGKVQMNTESTDPQYTALLTMLRNRMKMLAAKISPKVYEYGFLRK